VNKKRLRTLMLAVLALAATGPGCGNKNDFRAQTTTESGIAVVKNPGRPLYKNATLTFSEERSWSGREEGIDTFSTIDSFAVDADGTVFLCDENAALIKTYTAQGARLGAFPTDTEKAGGLEHPRIVGLTESGELAVESGGHRTLAFYARDGRLIRSISLAAFNIFRLGVDPQGRILMHYYRYVRPNVVYYLRLFDAGLKELWSYGQYWEPQSIGADFYAYLPILWWTIDARGGVVYGHPQRYELKAFDENGSPIRIIRREGRSLAISEAEKKAYRREYAKAPYVRLHFPEAHSAYQKFTVDEKGWMHVMLWEKAKKGAGYWYDIYDDKGLYTARVALDRMPQLWRGGSVYILDRHASGTVVLSRNRFALDLR
jgi:hypothetical protein